MQTKPEPPVWRSVTVRATVMAAVVAAVWAILQAAIVAHPWERNWLVLLATALVVAGFIYAEWFGFIRIVVRGPRWFLFYALVLAAGAAVAFV